MCIIKEAKTNIIIDISDEVLVYFDEEYKKKEKKNEIK